MRRTAFLLFLVPFLGCQGDGASAGDDSTSGATTTSTEASTASSSASSTSADTETGGTTTTGSTSAATSTGSTTGGTGGDPDPIPPELTACDNGPTGETIGATPDDYLSLIPTMQPGDRMEFDAGDYLGGLPITNLNGEAGKCFFFEGPEAGPTARFVGSSSRNTVSIRDSSFVVVRNLELDGVGELGDGVKAEGNASYSHHIVLEGLHIHDHDNNQQIVGISTKSPAWYWVIRGNFIETTGTGMYLGNSNGEGQFVASLVERNLVTSTLGYNIQIKHQNPRPALAGLPTDPQQTIVRHNVFSKEENANGGAEARPNLLLGHWPLSGAGVDDEYLVYGNFFFHNAVDALLQAEGNLRIYNNIFVNPVGSAVHIQPHNDVPRDVAVFMNTVVASGNGIRISGGNGGFDQLVIGNAVFAGAALQGGSQMDNATGSLEEAGANLQAHDAAPGEGLSVYPLASLMQAVATLKIPDVMGWDRDFDGRVRTFEYRGAYAGPRDGGWALAIEPKP